MPFARSRIDHADTIYVHSAPEALTVEVRSDDGKLLASGRDLGRTAQESVPMTKLTRLGDKIIREDVWLDDTAVGKLVILPGGKAGILESWWHSLNHSKWRWTVEFYNHR